jgi:hypothetical protein
LNLQSVRADIDLQAFRFLFGLVKIVTEHAYSNDQCANDELQDIAVAGHAVSLRTKSLRHNLLART